MRQSLLPWFPSIPHSECAQRCLSLFSVLHLSLGSVDIVHIRHTNGGGGPFVARQTVSALNPDLKMERQPADRSSRIDGGIKERRQNGIHNVSWRHDEGMSARSDALTPRTPTTDNLRAETQLSRRRWELSVRLKLVFRSGAEVGRWLIVNTKFA